MAILHKGYVPTKNKRCLRPFKDKSLMKLEEVEQLDEYAGVLAEGVILVDVDDGEQADRLFEIVKAEGWKCRVDKTTRGRHFYFMNNDKVDKCSVNSTLALGISADIKLGSRNSYAILKYKGKIRETEYDTGEYGIVPDALIPVHTEARLWGMDEGSGRNDALFRHILTLQRAGLEKDSIRAIMGLINAYVLKVPLKEKELATILRDEAFKDAVTETFFKGRTFKFNEFAEFLVKKYHIIKLNGQLHVYSEGVYIGSEGDIENVMIKEIPTLNHAKRQEVLRYLDILIRIDSQPSPATYIAFSNGILDITDNSFKPFSPDLIITNRIPHRYNPEAYAEIVDKLLDRLAVGDPSVRSLLEEVVGYCFFRRNELRKSFVLVGDKANGKSTFLDMLKGTLGEENIKALDLGELGARFKSAELFGKLANIGDDIDDGYIPNPAIFKKMVSGDRINAERKGCDPFDYNTYAKFIFSANEIPRIKDKTGAVVDRLVIVPFDAVFSKNDPDFDPYIKYKLQTENCYEYLIKLGIEGLKRVLKNNGFTLGTRTVARIEDYRISNNSALQFCAYEGWNCESIVGKPVKYMYSKYAEFCYSNNLQPLSTIEFSKALKRTFGVESSVKRIGGEVKRVFSRIE